MFLIYVPVTSGLPHQDGRFFFVAVTISSIALRSEALR